MFNFFFPQKNKLNDTKTDQIICSVDFKLKNDGSITTELYWPEFKNSSAKMDLESIAVEYATLLNLIGKGDFKQDIYETVLKAKENNPSYEDQKFISLLQFNMAFLDKFQNTFKHDDTQAIISPSSVFRKNS
jgi:hypothetical protein